MLLARLRNRLQTDKEGENQKSIKRTLDTINAYKNQQAESRANSRGELSKGKSSGSLPKIVLHIDDDPEDRELVQEAIKLVDSSVIVHQAKSGKDGIEFLTKAKSSGVLPCLIILDINMPGINGFETYSEIKKSDELKNIPVVVFTTAAVFKEHEAKKNKDLPVFIKPETSRALNASIRAMLTYHCS